METRENVIDVGVLISPKDVSEAENSGPAFGDKLLIKSFHRLMYLYEPWASSIISRIRDVCHLIRDSDKPVSECSNERHFFSSSLSPSRNTGQEKRYTGRLDSVVLTCSSRKRASVDFPHPRVPQRWTPTRCILSQSAATVS
jgi:hypothetical protein